MYDPTHTILSHFFKFLKLRSDGLWRLFKRSWDNDLDFQITIVCFFTTRGALPMKNIRLRDPIHTLGFRNLEFAKSEFCMTQYSFSSLTSCLFNLQSFWSRDCLKSRDKENHNYLSEIILKPLSREISFSNLIQIRTQINNKNKKTIKINF